MTRRFSLERVVVSAVCKSGKLCRDRPIQIRGEIVCCLIEPKGLHQCSLGQSKIRFINVKRNQMTGTIGILHNQV
jgi:hypothetical protein